jgi:hypothetical protein
MTCITRIILAALAALAIAAPAALASGGPMNPQTGTPLPQGTATHMASACTPGTRAVHGSAGTGCTTSPRDNSDQFGAFALILTGAGAFAIALGARAGGGRRRGRASTASA